MSSGFKVMEQTRKLLTDKHTCTHTHTQRKDENIIPPWYTSYAGGITTSCCKAKHVVKQNRCNFFAKKKTKNKKKKNAFLTFLFFMQRKLTSQAYKNIEELTPYRLFYLASREYLFYLQSS